MDDETERKIEEARRAAERQKQTAGFLERLTKNDALVKPIYNPEAFVMRRSAAARRRAVPLKWRLLDSAGAPAAARLGGGTGG